MRPNDIPDAAVVRTSNQLLPTLFDRLRDDAPSRGSEPASEYTVTPVQLRDIVQRDLSVLLNDESLASEIVSTK